MATSTDNWVEAIGKPAFEAIREMVEALTVDWERLEELREERDDWAGGVAELWAEDNPDEAEKLAKLQTMAGADLWAGTNPDDADELTELESAVGDCEDEDDARRRIDEDPLSIEVGGWWSPGSNTSLNTLATEYRILLTTGGPAVRIVGELGEGNVPISASLEVQDWFKPWTEYRSGDSDHDEVLLAYIGCFYLGD